MKPNRIHQSVAAITTFFTHAHASVVCSALLSVLLLTSAQAEDPTVEYIVHLDKPQTQTCTITIHITNIDADTIDVIMPTWRPGRYKILDFAGTVRSISAASGINADSGEKLEIQKIRKSAWRIPTSGENSLTVTYEIYANSISDRTRYVDDTHAFLSGSSVFMMVPSARNNACTVRIDAPSDWRIATGLATDVDNASLLHAANYDVLVDSPIEIGRFDRITFDVLDSPHEIVVWSDDGDYSEYDSQQLVEDFTSIIEHAHTIFGSFPYERYVFLLHVGDGLGGGTEHLNSTIMQTTHGFTDEGRYKGFLGLVSHEFFHTWNVKQFRPAGITPYDYENENYTTQLWIAEGTTSYYDDLLLVRSGLIDSDEYFKRITGGHSYVLNRPGTKMQSLAESSYDAWIKFNNRWPDATNTTVSFYTKGAVVSFLLDMEIRASTNNDRSLDDVMQEMYRQYPQPGPGYTEDDFQQLVEQIAGKPMGSFFDVFVRGTSDLPVAQALANVGLDLKRVDDEVKPYIGISAANNNGLWRVTSISSAGPAFDAGLIVNDRIVAINGVVPTSSINDAIEDLSPGDEVSITYLRRSQMRTATILAGSRPSGKWKISHAKEPTATQRAMYESWVGMDWPTQHVGSDLDENEIEQPK